MEQLVGAAVEVVGRDDLITRLGYVQDGKGRCGLAGRYRQSACAPLDGSHPPLEDIRCGIHDPRVDVPEFLQGEQVCCMGCILEYKGCGLVNGNRPCTRRRVRGFLPSVQRQSIQSFLTHLSLLSSLGFCNKKPIPGLPWAGNGFCIHSRLQDMTLHRPSRPQGAAHTHALIAQLGCMIDQYGLCFLMNVFQLLHMSLDI